MEREKKASPRASSTLWPVSMEKSGSSSWRTPAMAPGMERPTPTSSSIMTKSAGIIQRSARSTPFWMPPCTNHQVSPAKTR
ncbi:hypothetical protein D3C76_1488800 [compost metagenome]